MTRLILQHTTTLGVRSAIKKRWVLSRTESETVIPDDMLANVTAPDMPAESKAHELKTTGNGCTIRSKTSTGFGITRNKYEHDDLEKIARTYGLTLAQVRRACLPTCISHNSSTGTRLRNRPLSQKAV